MYNKQKKLGPETLDLKTIDLKILGLGSPFFDRFQFVEDEFLNEIHLVKGDTSLTDDAAYLEKMWRFKHEQDGQQCFKLGGSAANVIKVLAKLRNKTSLCGKIGADVRSEKLILRLKELKISPFLSIGTKGTGIVNCFITKDAQRTMLAYLGAAAELSETDITPEIFNSISHLHIEGYSACYGKCLEKSISLAKASNATISIDLASLSIVKSFKERWLTLLKDVDFIFGSKLEMQTLIEAFHQFKMNQTVVITDGANGCFVKGNGSSEFKHFDALKVTHVVDTTGAGDYFDGGFLHGILNGKTIAESVALGNMTASAVIQELGADLPDAKWESILAKISK